jgi:hypothetical protein
MALSTHPVEAPRAPRFRQLPAGIKFRKSPTTNVQASSVQNVPSSSTVQPDLPFGKPFHHRPLAVKDEPEDVARFESSLLTPVNHIQGATNDRIPTILPPEVQLMIDSYVSGRPIVAVASRAALLERWNISLKPEYAYAYLGFFRLKRVWVSCFVILPPSPR